MKKRHVEGAKQNARAVLNAAKASVGQDYHTLASWQIEIIVNEAARVRYRKPKNANGSTGRYFYERLQREARTL